MTEELIEVMRFLSAEEYVVSTPQGHYVFTNKFYTTFSNKDIGIIPNRTAAIARSETIHVVAINKVPAKPSEQYKQFILEAAVPRRIVNPRGESYESNQYSIDGAKAFAKILQRIDRGEITYELLVKSTMLYYKSSISYKLKVGNYISDGIWESHYRELADKLNDGTIEQHIKQELKDDNQGSSRYQLEQRTGTAVSRKFPGKG